MLVLCVCVCLSACPPQDLTHQKHWQVLISWLTVPSPNFQIKMITDNSRYIATACCSVSVGWLWSYMHKLPCETKMKWMDLHKKLLNKSTTNYVDALFNSQFECAVVKITPETLLQFVLLCIPWFVDEIGISCMYSGNPSVEQRSM